MATNIEIDEKLISRAMRLGGMRTKKDAVNEALAEYVRRKEQASLVNLFGKVDFDVDFDYKKQRQIR